MEDLIARALALIEANRVWAAPVVGLLAFGESMAVVGMAVPATAALVAVGGLIGAGVFDPLPIIAAAIIGAILGDWLSYLLGRAIGPRIYHRWPLNRHREAVARTRLFFRRYGFSAVFAGRFLGPVRATIPLVAGVLRMDRGRFQLANVASAAVWAPLLLAPGWIAGEEMGARAFDERTLLIFGVAVLAVTVVAGWASRRLLGSRRARRAAPAGGGSVSR